MNQDLDISVVVPLFNEAESLPELQQWIHRVMTDNGFTYEVIYVNDGSTDESWQVIKQLQSRYEQVRGISFRRNYGKARRSTPGLVPSKAEWSSPWMPTCRTRPTRFRNSTE